MRSRAENSPSCDTERINPNVSRLCITCQTLSLFILNPNESPIRIQRSFLAPL